MAQCTKKPTILNLNCNLACVSFIQQTNFCAHQEGRFFLPNQQEVTVPALSLGNQLGLVHSCTWPLFPTSLHSPWWASITIYGAIKEQD